MNKNTIIYDGDTHVVACCSRECGNRTKPLWYSGISGNPKSFGKMFTIIISRNTKIFVKFMKISSRE